MKKLIIISAVVIALAAVTVAVIYWPSGTNNNASTPDTTQTVDDNTTNTVIAANVGRYVPYEASHVEDDNYSRTILFFHAVWCPECRAFDKAIRESDIPSGTQVLQVNYDRSDELKQKYGVTLQSTFVRVDSDGNQVGKWVGYEQTKSLDAILTNTR